MSSGFLLLQLFWEFFKTGLFSIGGGLATLPFLSDMADRTGWFTQEQLANMVAVAESTPGPIGINTATYVGYVTAGILGGIIATLGLIAPSIIIISLIGYIIGKYSQNRFVKYTFYFIRPASLALICSAGFSLALLSLFAKDAPISIYSLSIPACIMAGAIFILTNFVKYTKRLHPIVWIGISALLGIMIF